MEGHSYDEDLAENRFFIIMQTKYRQLHQQASVQRLLICVPRTGVFARFSLSQADFETHILRPCDDQPGVYLTMNNKEVQLNGDSITTTKGFKEIRSVHILFEETYYNDNDESYRVVCIDRLLEGGNEVVEDPVMTCLETLDDCTDFLWGNKYSKHSQKQVDELITNFRNTTQQLETLRHIIDETSALFAMAMQIALKDTVLRKTVRQHHGHMDNLKTSMETYILHGVYNKVFKAIGSFLASQDAALNKTTRNLSELQVRDVGVRPEFTANVPRARRELSTINQYRTPLEKLHCLRRTVMAISQPGFRTRSKEPAPAMSSDDLLPLLVFLVVKADIPNWLANLTFMMNFRFSSFADGEFGFYLASVEAAVEHVKLGNMNNVVIGAANPQKLHVLRRMTSTDGMWQKLDPTDPDMPTIDALFQHAREGNTDDIAKMLEQSSNDHSWLLDQMCHPLCGCDKCEELVATKRNDPRAVTALSRDDRGCTAMHVAAMYGHVDVISVLISNGGDVNATDYHGSTPLHIACSRGQQHATLLLLHEGAKVNIEDNDGNTALHLCSANGHEDCMKAMMYSNQPVDINAANCQGDTPLHLTTRWGYESLVQLLLEHGASVEARNRRKETPIMCSYNVNISRSLQRVASTTSEGKYSYIQQASSPPIASSFDQTESTDSFATSFAKTTTRVRQRSRGSSTPTSKLVEKLLRAVADGDLLMVKYHLGWLSDSDESDDDEKVSSDAKLCHPLCQCSKCATLQKRTLVSSSGLSVNSSNAEGFSPLHVAAVHGHDAMVSLFLRRGAGINCRSGGSQQCTPLHLACQYNHPLVVNQLVQYGAKCNVKDSRGNTPLHYCCLNGHVRPARFLVKFGANVNQANHRGNTPLHEAARWNFGQSVKLLIEVGHANPLIRNKAQLMPIQLAQNDQVVKLLHDAAIVMEQEGSVQVTSPDPASPEVIHNPPNTLLPKTLSQPEDIAQSSRVSSGSSSVELGTSPRHVSLKDLFFSSGSVEMQQLQVLNKSVRDFDKSRRLRRSVTQDKSEPLLDQLKHQYSIQHFDRGRLRRTDTMDKSQPLLLIRAPSVDEAEPPRQGIEGWMIGNRGGHGLEGRHSSCQNVSPTENVRHNWTSKGAKDAQIESVKDGSTRKPPFQISTIKDSSELVKSKEGDQSAMDIGNKIAVNDALRCSLDTNPHEKFATGENVHNKVDNLHSQDVRASHSDGVSVYCKHSDEDSTNLPEKNSFQKRRPIVSLVEPEAPDDSSGTTSNKQSRDDWVRCNDSANTMVEDDNAQAVAPAALKELQLKEDATQCVNNVTVVAADGLPKTPVTTAQSVDDTSSPQVILSPKEMKGVRSEDFGQTLLDVPPRSVKGHHRVGSDISIDEMTSLTLGMNAFAESSRHRAEERKGYMEALQANSVEGSGVKEVETLMNRPLSDSDVDCMEIVMKNEKIT
ncbi:ankyrin repeat domain-containing protein 27-like [Asterias amurensis]|uniref:ankyrin repeat domain-containing protein 27-like n=1 Tax=Asterias amurensis TaxID=7602 RepID=UPI003AB8D80E